MAQIITMPRLSDTMTEGVVATWLKKVGDTIKTGDILAEIETDKATMEFESFYDGVLLHIGIQEGQSAPVDSLLAIIGKEGEDITALLSGGNATTETNEDKLEKVKTRMIVMVYQDYLEDTDHKFYGDYEPKSGEDLELVRAKRSEARAFVRANR